jgi:hypothetical protein
LAQRKKREYSKSELILGNLAIAVWILLGTAAFWLVFSFGAIVFLALAGFLVFYELGKKGCANCFFCKTCTIGMGKLPELFLTGTSVENLNINRKALKLFPFVYLLLSLVPIAITVLSIIQHFALYSLALLVALAAFSVLTGTVRRKILINL